MAVRRSKKRRVKSPVTPVTKARVKREATPKDLGGRPKWVPDAEQIKEIVKLAGLDHTIPEIGAWFGVNEKTIDRRLAEMPDLKERVEVARRQAQASFRQMMWRLANAGNPKAIGLLGAKMGWYPTQKVQHSGSVSVPVVVVPDNARAVEYEVPQDGKDPEDTEAPQVH